jgi:excisionase family DNA binding protein
MDTNNSSFKEVLMQLSTIQNMLVSNKTVMTLQDVATYTGLSISYLYKLTMTGILPHSKPNGKQIYVSKADLDAWLLSKSVRSDETNRIMASTYLTIKKGGLK